MITLDEQISWTEREIEFMKDGLTDHYRTWEDDIPVVEAILDSLNDLKARLDYDKPE